MSTIDQELSASLQAALDDIEGKRVALDTRENLLRTTLEGLRGSTNGSSPKPTTKPAPSRLSVSDERLDKVRQYLRQHPQSKQADLVKKLGFNSGTVSVALRVLEQQGEAQRVEDQSQKKSGPGRSSQAWDSTAPKKRARAKAAA